MDVFGVIDLLTGDGGVIAVLVIIISLIIAGKLVPSFYVRDIKDANEELKKTIDAQADSLSKLSNTSEEALDNIKIVRKMVSSIRTEYDNSDHRRGASDDEYL